MHVSKRREAISDRLLHLLPGGKRPALQGFLQRRKPDHCFPAVACKNGEPADAGEKRVRACRDNEAPGAVRGSRNREDCAWAGRRRDGNRKDKAAARLQEPAVDGDGLLFPATDISAPIATRRGMRAESAGWRETSPPIVIMFRRVRDAVSAAALRSAAGTCRSSMIFCNVTVAPRTQAFSVAWIESSASFSREMRMSGSLEKLALDSIQATERACILGATATFHKFIDDRHVPAALRSAAALTASRTLRNMMTIGGEVSLHPADSALIPLLVAMGAEIFGCGEKEAHPHRRLALADGRRPCPFGFHPGAGPPMRSPRGFANLSQPQVPRCCGVRTHASPPHQRALRSCMRLPGTWSGLRRWRNPWRAGRFPPGRRWRSRSEMASRLLYVHASSPYKLYMTRVLAADALPMMAGGKAGQSKSASP